MERRRANPDVPEKLEDIESYVNEGLNQNQSQTRIAKREKQILMRWKIYDKKVWLNLLPMTEKDTSVLYKQYWGLRKWEVMIAML